MRKHYYNRDDPFLGKKILWRSDQKPPRCEYCGKEDPQFICQTCEVSRYCSEDCANVHKKNIHTQGKCLFIRHFYPKWKDLPIYVGCQDFMENGLFSKIDIPKHTLVFSDVMMCGILFHEDKPNKYEDEEAWKLARDVEKLTDDEAFTYDYNMVKQFYFLRRFVLDFGMYSTLAMAEKKEVEGVENICRKLIEDHDKDINLGSTQIELYNFKMTVSFIYGIVKKNAFTLFSKFGSLPLIKGFFPLFSLMNNDCSSPNCIAYYTGDGKLQVFTCMDVKEGDHLTVAYSSTGCFLNYQDRKDLLHSRFSFDCKCSACIYRSSIPILEMNGHPLRECHIHTKMMSSQVAALSVSEVTKMSIDQKNHLKKHAICSFSIQLAMIPEMLAILKSESSVIPISGICHFAQLLCTTCEALNRCMFGRWFCCDAIYISLFSFILVLYLTLRSTQGTW